MTLFPMTGQSAGYPVSSDSYGQRQDTTTLMTEFRTPPWTSGALSIASNGDVSISNASGGTVRAYWLEGLHGSGHAGMIRMLGGSHGIEFAYDGKVGFWVDGSWIGSLSGDKTFVIEHPTSPDRLLVHACLEGPEVAVFYRGEVELDEDARAEVLLPDYFIALTQPGSATVQVSPILEDERSAWGPVAATRIKDGRFTIRGTLARQPVSWLVHARRGELNVEPARDEVQVKGTGPYRWVE